MVEDKEYKLEGIKDNSVCNKVVEGQLLRLYYLVSLKNNMNDGSNCKSASTVINF